MKATVRMSCHLSLSLWKPYKYCIVGLHKVALGTLDEGPVAERDFYDPAGVRDIKAPCSDVEYHPTHSAKNDPRTC